MRLQVTTEYCTDYYKEYYKGVIEHQISIITLLYLLHYYRNLIVLL